MVRATTRPRSRRCLTSAEAWQKVERVARRLNNTTTPLGNRESKQISIALKLLNNRANSTRQQKYRDFLGLVAAEHGLQVVRLCAAALGQVNIRDMNEADRKLLSVKLGELQYHGLSFILSSDTKEAGVIEGDNSVGSIDGVTSTSENNNSQHSIDPGAAKRASASTYLSNSESALFHNKVGEQTSNHYPQGSLAFGDGNSQENPDITNTQVMFEYASVDGIAAVFEGLIRGAIRETSPFVHGTTCAKASVTTVFPPWGAVDCLLSLDICETSVEPLAMALFGTTVKWVNNSLHIGLATGASLTLPNSEVTFKGVQDDAIARVFGSEIQQAIKESRIRVQEMEKGRMVVTDHMW